MGTFNAGAVEARLILDRSDWVEDLRKTKKDIEDLERSSINIGIELADDDIQAELDRLNATLEKFEQKSINPDVSIDTDFVEEQIAWMEGEFDRLDKRTITISVDMDLDNAIIALDNFEANYLDPLDVDTIVVDVRTDVNDRELDVLETRLDRMDRRRYMIQVDVDADNALVQLSGLEAFLDVLDTDDVVINVDVDSAAAEAKLLALAQFIQMLSISDPTVRFDIDGYSTAIAQMTTLEGQIAALDGRDIDIQVDYDRGAFTSLVGPAGGGGGGGGGGHMGLLKILIIGIISLAPILAVALSASLAAIVGFSAALVAALGPAIILAGGLIGLVQRFNDTDIEDRSPSMQRFADAIDNVKDAWETVLDLAEKSGAFDLMANALNLVADVLPRLEPIFDAAVDMFDGVIDGVSDFVDSPEFNEMIEFFSGFGVDMLETFMGILGNLIVFFGRLFDAVAPFARVMMDGLNEVIAGWAEWAGNLEDNDGFQEWLARALEYGPRVFDMLGSLWDALMNIGAALRPFAGPMLDHLTWFFDLIANMDTDQLTILIGLLAGLWTALTVGVPLIGALITGVEVLAAVLGLIFSPLGAILIGLAALGALLYYLWTTNEDFRDGIITTWNEISEFLMPIISDIVAYIQDNWGPIREWIMALWTDVQSIVMDAFTIIEQIIRGVLRTIQFIWDGWGTQILQILTGTVQAIGSIIRGIVGVIRGVFQIISGIMTGNWSKAWEGVKTILRSARDMITGILNGLGKIWGGIVTGAGNAIKRAFNAAIDGLKKGFADDIAWIKEKWEKLKDFFQHPLTGISNLFAPLLDGFRQGINGIISIWNSLDFHIDIPDKIPGLPDEWNFGTPNINYFAKGGYITDPTLGVIGEGPDNEIIAPEPILKQIVRENSGANLDYGRLASAIASALRAIPGLGGVSTEDLERLIEAASVNLNIDARSEGDRADTFAEAIIFKLKVLGYGGVTG